MRRTIKVQIEHQHTAEFEIQLDALFDAEQRIIDEKNGDWRKTFQIQVHNDAEQSWVELLAEEIQNF